MQLIADGLLITTALAAAIYCLVLSRRLRRLTDSEAGIGAQIKALNAALDETKAGLGDARRSVSEHRAAMRNEVSAMAAELGRAAEARQALAELNARSLGLQKSLDDILKAHPADHVQTGESDHTPAASLERDDPGSSDDAWAEPEPHASAHHAREPWEEESDSLTGDPEADIAATWQPASAPEEQSDIDAMPSDFEQDGAPMDTEPRAAFGGTGAALASAPLKVERISL